MKSRTFKNPVILQEMLYLRIHGWSLKDLAFRYDCDHTSIRKACLRNGLPSRLNVIPHPIIVFRLVWRDIDGERINIGKSYKEYLKEQEERRSQTPTF